MDWQGGNTGWGSNTFPFSYGTQGTNGTPLRQDHYTELPAYLEYNEEVEEEEDDELYFQQQEQAAAQGLTHSPGFVYAFHPTFESQQHESDTSGPLTPSLSTSTPTNEDTARNQEKAALLKAKLLEKRVSSRGPVPGELSNTFKPPPPREITQTSVEKSLTSNSSIESLLRDERAAAEAKAKMINGYFDYTETGQNGSTKQNGGQVTINSVEPPTPQTTKEDRPAGPRKQKSEGVCSTNHEHLASEASMSAGSKKTATAGKYAGKGKQKAKLQAGAGAKGTGVSKNKMGNNQPKGIDEADHTKDAKIETAPSRSDTLLSTSTIQQDATTRRNSFNERDSNLSARSNKLLDDVAQTAAEVNATDAASTALAQVQGSPQAESDLSTPSGSAFQLLNAEDEPPREIAAYSHHFDDLDEWLEITGYHDRGNRDNVLALYRRRAELEREMAEVERELEQNTVHRPRTKRAVTTHKNQLQSSHLMAPPPNPIVDPKAESTVGGAKPSTALTNHSAKRPRSPHRATPTGTQHVDKKSRLSTTDKSSRENVSGRPTLSKAYEASSGPRRADMIPNSDLRMRGTEEMSDQKSPTANRHHSNAQAAALRGDVRSHSPRRMSISSDHLQYDDRGRLSTHGSTPPRPVYGFITSPTPSTWNAYRPALHVPRPFSSERQSSYRGRGASRGGRRASHRGHSVFGGSSRYSEGGNSIVKDLQKGGSRYFMIKSWNHENVDVSQHDGIWVTQTQNEELLSEAFKTARNVILCFSVNKSTAFQGYARMESLPGTAPQPSWVKDLRWPSSPPFYVRWITVAETRFSKVGHLKNMLNEGQAVLVGRDGQEIEESCGLELCKLIDEAKERSG